MDNKRTCRGSMRLGGGCGICLKCLKEIESMQQAKTDIPYTLQGWVCPKCGAGNSPGSNRCPCVPIPPPVVTC